MSPRAIAALLPPLLFLGAIFWILEKYGKAILIALIACVGLFIFGRYVGPMLPAFLGGDPTPEHSYVDLQWDLYVAIQGDNIDEARRLLNMGADPFAQFHRDRSPSCSDAKTCYEFACSNPRSRGFLLLFEEHRNRT